MARENVTKLIARYDRAVAQKDSMRSLYDMAFKMSVPDRDTFSSKTQGGRSGIGLFDSTGVIATQRFVNHMQASLTPPFKRWIQLKAGPVYEENKDVADRINQALETVTDIAFRIIEASNFNVAMAEFYQELAVGTGVMLVKEGETEDEPIYFITVPIDQIAIEENPYNGKVRAVFRTHTLAAILIKDTWPDAKLTEEMREQIKNNPMHEYCLIECTYVDNETKNIYYDVILKGDKTRLVERKMTYNAWVTTRWSKKPGECLGRGPVIQALNDLCMLNMAKELGLRSAQLNAYGVWTVADSDIVNPNTLVLSPGVFIPVSRNAGPNGPSIAPLARSGDPSLQQFMVQELQDHIRQIMLNDRMPPEVGPVRSATEIAARIQSNRIDTESAFGRLMYEFVQPLWQNILYILNKKGIIALPPELERIDNFSLKIDVLSPIAREQNIEDIQNLMNAAQMISAVGGPEAVHRTFKPDVYKYISDRLGVSPDVLRTEEEIQELEHNMQQQQAMQMAMMAAQQGGQNG